MIYAAGEFIKYKNGCLSPSQSYFITNEFYVSYAFETSEVLSIIYIREVTINKAIYHECFLTTITGVYLVFLSEAPHNVFVNIENG